MNTRICDFNLDLRTHWSWACLETYYNTLSPCFALDKVKRESIISNFLFKADVSEVSSLLLQCFERSMKEIQRDTPFCLLSPIFHYQQTTLIMLIMKNFIFTNLLYLFIYLQKKCSLAFEYSKRRTLDFFII